MWYELWGVEAGNLMHDFATEAEALDAVRAYLTPNDTGAVVDVELVIYDDDTPTYSIHGAELAARAGATDAPPRPLPA